MTRNHSIDTLKGILILFVILGHFFVEPVRENDIKRAIYIFHMPLFIGISGYLFSDRKINEYTNSIKFRFLIPWIIASIFYLLFLMVIKKEIPFTILDAIIDPWFHLWFIPCLITYSIISCLFRMKNPLLLISIGIIPIILKSMDFNLLKIIGPFDSRFLYYAIFFFIGLFVRKTSDNTNVFIYSLSAITGIILSIYTFNKGISDLSLSLIRSLMVFGAIGYLSKYKNIKTKIGNSVFTKESLSLYLYHVFVILIIRNIFDEHNIYYWISCSISTFLILPFIVTVLRKTNSFELILGKLR